MNPRTIQRVTYILAQSFQSTSGIIFFFFLMIRRPPRPTLFPSTPLFRSNNHSRFFLIVLAAAALAPAARAQFQIDWYTIDGGGGTSSGGTFSLTATIGQPDAGPLMTRDRKSTRLNSSHSQISYAVFCLKK